MGILTNFFDSEVLSSAVISDQMKQLIVDECNWITTSTQLLDDGWHYVTVETSDDYDAVKKWCGNNIKGPFVSRYGRFIFQNQDDAAWFALRWSA